MILYAIALSGACPFIIEHSSFSRKWGITKQLLSGFSGNRSSVALKPSQQLYTGIRYTIEMYLKRLVVLCIIIFANRQGNVKYHSPSLSYLTNYNRQMSNLLNCLLLSVSNDPMIRWFIYLSQRNFILCMSSYTSPMGGAKVFSSSRKIFA